MEKQIRGAALLGYRGFIENGLTPAQRARAISQFPLEHADADKIGPNDLYPVERSYELVQAIASAIDDEAERYEAFIRCGQVIANDAINSFLRLLIKFLKPHLFARKYGAFFRRAHTFGHVEPKEFTEHSFVLEMSGMEGYPYPAPVTIGFIKHTLDAMGCKNIQVREVLSPPPAPQTADRYRFEVSWS
jgi:uncharacterized protein (TIGR02265 family)